LWTAFTTGARRGEVSALRENRFDFARQQIHLARNYLVKQGQHIEKAPKDGEGRVLSLDLLTCELLQERFQRRRAEARTLGVAVPEDAFAFSPDPAGQAPWNPDTMMLRPPASRGPLTRAANARCCGESFAGLKNSPPFSCTYAVLPASAGYMQPHTAQDRKCTCRPVLPAAVSR
jgi:hypothetical protein